MAHSSGRGAVANAGVKHLGRGLNNNRIHSVTKCRIVNCIRKAPVRRVFEVDTQAAFLAELSHHAVRERDVLVLDDDNYHVI
eukprot:6456681-Amphidinium_carterae.3